MHEEELEVVHRIDELCHVLAGVRQLVREVADVLERVGLQSLESRVPEILSRGWSGLSIKVSHPWCLTSVRHVGDGPSRSKLFSQRSETGNRTGRNASPSRHFSH